MSFSYYFYNYWTMKSPKGTSKYHVLISGLQRPLDSNPRFSLSRLYTKIYTTLRRKKKGMKTKTVRHPTAKTMGKNSTNKISKLKWTSKPMGHIESHFESWKRTHAGLEGGRERHCSSSITFLWALGSSLITNQDTGLPASSADNAFWCNLSLVHPPSSQQSPCTHLK